jgi:hypothetical protein
MMIMLITATATATATGTDTDTAVITDILHRQVETQLYTAVYLHSQVSGRDKFPQLRPRVMTCSLNLTGFIY